MTSVTFRQLLTGLKSIVGRIKSKDTCSLSADYKSQICGLLEGYQVQLNDYKPYLFFDKSGYTKNLVESWGDTCNVIVMCWSPGQASALHAHEGSRCFVKVLEGKLNEIQMPHPAHPDSSESRCEKVLLSGDIRYLDDSLGMHQVTNGSSTKRAVTLHVYLPAYSKCRIFDSMHNPTLDQSRVVDVTFTSELGVQSSQTD